jgi:NaMN:DMB phosphoribosyltransferase
MAGVLSVIKEIDPDIIKNLVIVTTNWIIKDETSNLIDLVNEIHPIPVIATKLSFSNSNHKGLQAYEYGVVKEGVGAGGSAIAAYIKSKGNVNNEKLLMEIERNYKDLVSNQ